ncbi:MAG TPA: hypothetical protein VEF76_00830 [Patescibacteria group bacterium]|nr:hypothetical protein [Patescibacteria group bacterium]
MSYDFSYILADDLGHIERARMVSEDIRDGARADYIAYHATLKNSAEALIIAGNKATARDIDEAIDRLSTSLQTEKLSAGLYSANRETITTLRRDNEASQNTASGLIPEVKKLRDVFQFLTTAEEVAKDYPQEHTTATKDMTLRLSLTLRLLEQLAPNGAQRVAVLDRTARQLDTLGEKFAQALKHKAAASYLLSGPGAQMKAPRVASFRRNKALIA